MHQDGRSRANDCDSRRRCRYLRGALAGAAAVFAAMTMTALAQAPRADWPQWRGPNRDGAAGAFSEPRTWPGSLRRQWTVEVGLGYAAPLVVGNRVYAFSRQEPNEVLQALDLATGTVIWRSEYPAPFTPNPAATRTHGTGPKSTPTIADGRIFTLGMSGIVTAFDAATGKQLWQKPAPPTQPLYHTAMSPLVDRGLVIVHVGGHNDGALTAFDVATGAVKWSWTGDGPAYGSPVVAELDGVPQIVTLTQEHLVSVSADTGALLWQRPFQVRATRNAVTPIVHGNAIIVSGLGRPVTALTAHRRGDAWSTEDIWENDEVTMDMSTGVLVNGVLYGFSPRNSGQYFAVDANTGKTLWLTPGRQAANAAVVRAGGVWMALEDDAELVVLRPSTAAFDVIQRYTVADSATWAQPVLSGNRVLVKDVATVSSWTVG